LVLDGELFPKDSLTNVPLPSIEEAAKLMGSKGKRILRAHEEDVSKGAVKFKKSYNVKWDETIPLKWVETVDGMAFSIKPRSICNLDPVFHSRTTCHARLIADALHAHWDGWKVYSFGLFNVIPCFASGFTSSQLSNMMSSWKAYPFQHPTLYVAFAGDDSVALFTHKYGDIWVEADQSAFDQSQDEGPLFIAGPKWMRHMGVPEEVIALWLKACKDGYKVNKKSIRVTGSTPVELPTGLTLTTVWNSVNCFLMYCFYAFELSVQMVKSKGLLNPLLVTHADRLQAMKLNTWRNYDDYWVDPDSFDCVPVFDFVASAKLIGFNVKAVVGDNGLQRMYPTFLKGWWFYDEMISLMTWMPLPSMVIKLGKTLKDPSRLYAKSDDPIGCVAYNLSMSYCHVPSWYPVLGPFLAKLKSLSKRITKEEERNLIEGFEYKTKVTTNLINHEYYPNAHVNSMPGWHIAEQVPVSWVLNRLNVKYAMCDRYKTTFEEIEECENLIEQVTVLPSYIQHSLFVKFQAVDYR